MTTVKPATAEQRAHWLTHANFKWQPYGSLFSEAVTAYEAALVALESELAALKAEYVPNPTRNKGEKFMEFAAKIGCPPTAVMATNEAPSGAFATKAEATIETLTKDLAAARGEAAVSSGLYAGTERTLNLLRGDIATALGGVYGTPGFDCIADLTAKVRTLRTERDDARAAAQVQADEIARMTAELQRAHEAGERMQADASRWRLMAEATIRTLTVDLAAAVKRADAAETKLGQAIVALRRAKNEDQLYCDCDCDCDCSEFPGRAPGSIGTDVKTVLTDADRIAQLTAELVDARRGGKEMNWHWGGNPNSWGWAWWCMWTDIGNAIAVDAQRGGGQ